MPHANQREKRQQLYRINGSVIHRSRRPPAPGMALPRLLIFGVDGTLRRGKDPQQPYPRRRADWELMPEVAEVLACYPLQAAGRGEIAVGLVSNQDAVARGEMSRDRCERMLWDLLYQALEVRPADLFFGHRLPLGRQSSQPPLTLLFCASAEPDNIMRLPGPGQLHVLLERHAVAPLDALLVGSEPDEATAAYLAGVPFVAAWDFFGWPAPPRALMHVHRCDVCRRYLELRCHCLDAGRYVVCPVCQEGGV